MHRNGFESPTSQIYICEIKAVQIFMFCATEILYLCHAYDKTYVT